MSWEPFGRIARDQPPSDPSAPEAAAPPAGPDPRRTALPRKPARALAVLTCMDGRIDPLAHLGLRIGDAVVLRNAGAQVSNDVERSLRLAVQNLGVQEVWLVGHVDCVAHGGDDAAAERELQLGAERLRGALDGISLHAMMLDAELGSTPPGA